MNASHTAPTSLDLHDRNAELVSRLQKSQIYRDYQQAFQTATGLPLTLRAAGAFQEPMRGAKNVNAYCAIMAAESKTCAACLQLQGRAEAAAVTETKTLQCVSGINETLVPLRIGETTVAYLQTGQVRFREPTERQFQIAMKQVAQGSTPTQTEKLHKAFFETRVLARSHYDAMVRLLTSFAQHLALVANELVIKESAVEPPAVARARAYITEHLGEPLSLELVAGAAHMSAFYFCKVFKAATGLTLTDYVARARVERVKQLMLNPHTRISEAAYEAGFQSLSQFNRVFRRVAGQAPSAYREQLHGTAESSARPAAALAFAA